MIFFRFHFKPLEHAAADLKLVLYYLLVKKVFTTNQEVIFKLLPPLHDYSNFESPLRLWVILPKNRNYLSFLFFQQYYIKKKNSGEQVAASLLSANMWLVRATLWVAGVAF